MSLTFLKQRGYWAPIFLFTAITLATMSSTAYASRQVTGIVQDEEKKTALKGANIVVVDPAITCVSTNSGRFNFRLPTRFGIGDTIEIRVVLNGYKTRDIEYNLPRGRNPRPLRIEMSPSVPPAAVPAIFGKFQAPAAQRPNPFLNVGRPEIWFNEAKYYKRIDSEGRASLAAASNADDLLSLSRTYTSNQKEAKAFGVGWSHPLERTINIEKSSLCNILYSNENGKRINFRPQAECSTVVQKASGIWTAVREDTTLADILEFERATGKEILFSLRDIPYAGFGLSYTSLEFLSGGFRTLVGGQKEALFDSKGRLRTVYVGAGKDVDVTYDVKGRCTGASQGDWYVGFEYNKMGFIDKVSYEDGTTYEYSYAKHGYLTTVFQSDKKIATYSYDKDSRLILSEYENSREIIAYNELGLRTKIERNSGTTTWQFIDDDPFRHKVVQTLLHDGVSIKAWTYVFDTSDQVLQMSNSYGVSLNYRIGACGCNPLEVSGTEGTIRYSYDRFGRITKVEQADNSRIEIGYDEEFGKISFFRRWRNGGGKEETIYRYTDFGQLEYASNSSSEWIRLKYDRTGKIVKMSMSEKELGFSYNANGKPDSISLMGIGSITVTYDENGEIENVVSDEGHKMALEVTSAFQLMLRIVKVADVNIDTRFHYITSPLNTF